MSTYPRTFRRVAAPVFGVLLAVGLSGGLAYANAAHAGGHAPAHSVPAAPQRGGGLATARPE